MGWPSCRAHCGYSPPTLPLIKEYPLAKQERLKEISKARNTLPTVGWLRVNFFSAQRRKVAKIKTPWRLCSSAPLREQKSAAADLPCCGTARLWVRLFFCRVEEPLHQSTQPQGAGGVSIGLVRSNRTENSVADPSLLRL